MRYIVGPLIHEVGKLFLPLAEGILAMHWFVLCLKKYAVFSGRARRAEYWYFSLFCILFSVGLSVIEMVAFGVDSMDPHQVALSAIFGLAVTIPSLAVSVRRLHDIDKSGWWFLLHLVVLVGTIILLIWACKSGNIGPNRFGEDPKEEGDGPEEAVDPNPSHPHHDIPDSDSQQ
jgi:uncharacterized membrane protein YhaH (DUF805 family)